MFHTGDVVRKMRLARGLTIPDLADLAGVNKMTVSGIERGDNHTRDSLAAVARALGLADETALEARLTAWAELRTGPTAIREEWQELFMLWEILDVDPDGQRLLLELIRREALAVSLRGEAPAGNSPAVFRPAVKRRPRPPQTNTSGTNPEIAIVSASVPLGRDSSYDPAASASETPPAGIPKAEAPTTTTATTTTTTTGVRRKALK